VDRRAFLGLSLGASSTLFASRVAGAGDEGDAARGMLEETVGAPQNLATPLAWFDRLLTPTDVFFVRSHFGAPRLDPGRRVAVEGMVERAVSLSGEDLKKAFEAVTITAVLQCAGNGRRFHAPRVPGVQWGHGAMGQATFTGVRLRDVLTRAGVAKDAAFVHLAGADAPPRPSVPAFLRSLPLARAMDPTTIVAWAMNGEPLTLAHGAPLRLVVPGWAGDHWVKWLSHVRLAKDEADGFYMRTAYKMPVRPVAPGAAVKPEDMRSLTTFPVRSVIARPSDGARTAAGVQEVSGCAFSGEAPITKVEVSTDGGVTWKAAMLEGKAEAGRWVVWKHRFDAKPGRATAKVRATDGKGNVQPESAAWNPSGYFWNAWHAASWEVA
jgi:DMSO/TMAO reductase YedYZ molybdopterin-dependent catalytic subunit